MTKKLIRELKIERNQIQYHIEFGLFVSSEDAAIAQKRLNELNEIIDNDKETKVES